VCNTKDDFNTGAVLEWTIAFIFTFYILSFFIDLIPAVHTKNRTSQETELQMEANDPSAQMHEAQYDGVNYHGDWSRLGRNF
jgi:hypothetical protein